jgi:hypothetical protein
MSDQYTAPWRTAEVATPEQKADWTRIVNAALDTHHYASIPSMISKMMVEYGTTFPGYQRTYRQMERFLRESPDFEIRIGRYGGVFQASKHVAGVVCLTSTNCQYVRCQNARYAAEDAAVPPVLQTPVDNYTCGCGNSKLCTHTDKSCWRCGAPVQI